ncbi:MAG: hypothetical protein H0U74_10885 [Bradymonadaceae bacterium]|nr:hypothetical protein [Lujinxingiaceae bacterium]
MSNTRLHVLSALFVALFLVFGSANGFAQSWPEEQLPPEQRGVDPLEDPAWMLYHQALMEMYQGKPDASKLLLEQLVREHPQHSATALALRALQVMALVNPRTTPDEPAWDAQPSLHEAERVSAQARAELAIFQTIHGIIVGGELCYLLDCDDARPIVAGLALGAATGLGLSLLLTQDGLTAGHASLLNSATTWGFWSGLTLGYALDLPSGDAYVTSMLIGQLGGLGTGALLWSAFEPTVGTVAVANSGGIWTTLATFFLLGVFQLDVSDRVVVGSLFAASHIGLVSGALFASRYPISRSRMLLIDAGGILGMLLSTSTIAIIGGDVDSRPVFAAALVGMLGGLGAATYFTRAWDLEQTGAQLFILPTDEGAIVGLGGRF